MAAARDTLLLFGLLAALPACTLGPDYQPPATHLPGHWSEPAPKAADGGFKDLGHWWRGFQDARLSALVERALRMDGTCTGEHGVGLHKMDFLVAETGTGAVDMMRAIKTALDPHNIMNPGKIFTL